MGVYWDVLLIKRTPGGKMAREMDSEVTEALDEAEKLLSLKSVNEAVDILNRIGTYYYITHTRKRLYQFVMNLVFYVRHTASNVQC